MLRIEESSALVGSANYDFQIYPAIAFEAGMTAIVAVRTASGFIIAADGRMRLTEDSQRTANAAARAKECDSRQKIFRISDSAKNLAFAITGSVGDSNFDLPEVVALQAKQLAGEPFDDCRGYLNELARKCNVEINEAVKAGIFRLPEEGRMENSPAWKTASLIVAGYFATDRCFFRVDLFHFGNNSESKFSVDAIPDVAVVSGSPVISTSMFKPNGELNAASDFYQYGKQLGSSLDDAEGFASGYIRACSSDLAKQRDKRCEIIGGDLHVAEITPRGFRWRIPPGRGKN